jgi:hypothetical protein
MKKFLLFLMFFSFVFSGYCGEILVDSVDFNTSTAPNFSYSTKIAKVVLTIPSDGDYKLVLTVTNDWGIAGYTDGSSSVRQDTPQAIAVDTVESSTISYSSGDKIGVYTLNTRVCIGTLKLYRVVDGNSPVITSATSVNATAGQPFSYTTTATGDPTITYSSSDLPAFLTGDGASITGTVPVTQTTDFSFKVRATNSVGYDEETVTVHVTAGEPPVWINTINVIYDLNSNVNLNIISLNWVTGTPTISVSVQSGSSLPPFLSLSNNVLSGTCTTVGTWTFYLQASNLYGVSSRLITFTVRNGSLPEYIGPDPCVIRVTRGLQFSQNLLVAWWKNADSYTISDLPSWASISSDGLFSGICPTDETRQNITGLTMTAINSYGSTSVNDVEIEILGIGDSLYFTSPSTAQGTIGQPFTYTATTNQTSGVTFSMSNNPSWLSCTSSGVITGTVPTGTTGFSFDVTAFHAELGNVTLKVNCTAVAEGESGVATHVIVDNFSDFGTTQWAKDMKSYLADSSQEFQNIRFGVDALVSRQNIISNALESIGVNISSIGNKLDTVNGNLVLIDDDMNTGFTNVKTSLDSIDDNIVDGFDDVTSLLTQIRDKMDSNPTIAPDDLDLPVYEFDTDFGDFTEAYSSTEISAKTKVSQFDFVETKLNGLLAVQSDDLIISVPLAGYFGFTENPSLNLTQDSNIRPFIDGLRTFWAIVIYIIGCYWWTTIIMGFFV